MNASNASLGGYCQLQSVNSWKWRAMQIGFKKCAKNNENASDLQIVVASGLKHKFK